MYSTYFENRNSLYWLEFSLRKPAKLVFLIKKSFVWQFWEFSTDREFLSMYICRVSKQVLDENLIREIRVLESFANQNRWIAKFNGELYGMQDYKQTLTRFFAFFMKTLKLPNLEKLKSFSSNNSSNWRSFGLLSLFRK